MGVVGGKERKSNRTFERSIKHGRLNWPATSSVTRAGQPRRGRAAREKCSGGGVAIEMKRSHYYLGVVGSFITIWPPSLSRARGFAATCVSVLRQFAANFSPRFLYRFNEVYRQSRDAGDSSIARIELVSRRERGMIFR